MALIKIKRGTASQIQSGSSFSLGEPILATDTKELYMGNGTGTADLVGSYVQTDTLANRPSAGIVGRLFYATDQQFLYIDEGTGWRTFDPVGIQKYNYVSSDADAGDERMIMVDASSNDVQITLPASKEIDGRTYYISRLDDFENYSVFVIGSGLEMLIGDAEVAIGGGYTIGGYTVKQTRNIEIVWRDAGSKWELLNQIMYIDGGAF